MPSSAEDFSLLAYWSLLEFVIWEGIKNCAVSVRWNWTGLLGKGRDPAMGTVESQQIRSIGL